MLEKLIGSGLGRGKVQPGQTSKSKHGERATGTDGGQEVIWNPDGEKRVYRFPLILLLTALLEHIHISKGTLNK